MKFQQFLTNKKDLDLTKLPKKKIFIFRNITIEPILPYLEYQFFKSGFDTSITLSNYDNIIQDVLNENFAVAHKDTDIFFLFTKLDILSPLLSNNFSSLSDEQIKDELNRIHSFFTTVMDQIRKSSKALVLSHNFELPTYPSYGIYDYQTNRGQLATIQNLNEILRTTISSYSNSFVVDTNHILQRMGSDNYFDLRYWHISKSPYSRMALEKIAEENIKFLKALQGQNKKCLVLDCDNTLWGGIIGEDGIDGVQISDVYPGSIYREFQLEILNLYHRGVIIALCSKNNEKDVWQVFDENPNMILKKTHIAAHQINWNDKATNLKLLAKELNISLDSMVFVDDSDFEINLVNDTLPEVETIHIDSSSKTNFKNQLASCGYFDTLTITNDDKNRGLAYQSEKNRTDFVSKFTNIDDYLKSLEMTLEITKTDQTSVPRVAQLTQKTNQFNLTTIRYSEEDISAFVKDKSCIPIHLSFKDRFGDAGIIGVIILKIVNTTCSIDTFLLSCRVIGRGIEYAVLNEILSYLKNRGVKEVQSEYRSTKKNDQVKKLYSSVGFSETEQSRDFTKFKLILNSDKTCIPETFFKNILTNLN